MQTPHPRSRVLVIVPAHNEAATISSVLAGLRRAAPTFDRLVINDGSTDRTEEIVAGLGERQLDLLCNIGYGPALQAGLRYADRHGYEVVAFCDADGQHRPEDVPRLVEALDEWRAAVVIGSRYGAGRPYTGPLSRRIGQRLFSHLARLAMGRRIYDTTSGLKAVHASAFPALLAGTYLDFHAETLVELTILGFDVRELATDMDEREHGQSMHSWASIFVYPAKTIVLTVVGVVNALLPRRAP